MISSSCDLHQVILCCIHDFVFISNDDLFSFFCGIGLLKQNQLGFNNNSVQMCVCIITWLELPVSINRIYWKHTSMFDVQRVHILSILAVVPSLFPTELFLRSFSCYLWHVWSMTIQTHVIAESKQQPSPNFSGIILKTIFNINSSPYWQFVSLLCCILKALAPALF